MKVKIGVELGNILTQLADMFAGLASLYDKLELSGWRVSLNI